MLPICPSVDATHLNRGAVDRYTLIFNKNIEIYVTVPSPHNTQMGLWCDISVYVSKFLKIMEYLYR